jgi:DNA-binding transcriptional ArsR family regulator
MIGAQRARRRYAWRMTLTRRRGDEAVGLRVFKAAFFRALGHPQRIHILELLRDGPMSVGQLQDATDSPGSSVSQHLGVLRAANIVATERQATTILYRVPDPELFELLDVARRIFNIHLTDTVDVLRLVEEEAAGSRGTAVTP